MYDWTKWLDHVTDPSNRYTLVDNGDGTFTISRTGTVMQQGTPQDQVRFNNIENGIVDAHLAVDLLLNYTKQRDWAHTDKETELSSETIGEVGTVTLSNSETFPFNNSQVSVSLTKARSTLNYIVIAEVTAATGNVGEIVISDKLVNGFKIAFTGSATSATVKYKVIGGFLV